MAPTAVTCGLPSALIVVSQVVRALCASGAGADPASSLSTMVAQSTGGRPSAAPRLVISMALPPSWVDESCAVVVLRRVVAGEVIYPCSGHDLAARDVEGDAGDPR